MILQIRYGLANMYSALKRNGQVDHGYRIFQCISRACSVHNAYDMNPGGFVPGISNGVRRLFLMDLY